MNPASNELAALTRALQNTLVRKQRLGLRRTGAGQRAPAVSQIETQPPAPTDSAPKAPQTGQNMASSGQKAPSPANQAPAPTTSPQSQATRAAACSNLEQLAQATAECQACPLHQARTRPIFADGAPAQGGILFLGESAEAQDSGTGTPFSGPAGQLLTDIIVKGMKLDRQQVAITNLVKCPTPGGRRPSAEEIHMCAPFLERQLDLLAPGVLVPLGEGPANFLLATNSSLDELRGKNFERQGRQVVPTYHPAQLLQEPAKKRDCWSDIQRAMGLAGNKKTP